MSDFMKEWLPPAASFFVDKVDDESCSWIIKSGESNGRTDDIFPRVATGRSGSRGCTNRRERHAYVG
ncbi:MAG: hypothetical protein Kow0080_12890 [Candidatus Promineifilaceae bacterium]